jgi:signal transduction histidine kinase
MAMRVVFLRRSSKIWAGAVMVCTAALVLAALILPRSFQLTAISDWIQSLLLLSGTLALIARAIRSRGRLRVFWVLLASGVGFWFLYQAMWTYFEVGLKLDVPDLFAGDIVLFLHIVPLMAALALRPHALQDEYSSPLRRLDFALMMVWWVYLYVFAVMAWQYVVANVPAYDSDLNFLYLIEKAAFLGALLIAWSNSEGGWKILYSNLFGASLTYACSSYLANWAIGRHAYYSGSLYDIPLTTSMAWITLIGLWTRDDEPQSSTRSGSTSHGLWLARVGMIAVFSLPLLAAWVLSEPGIPSRIRSFRLVLTLGAALRLLEQSRESFANLKRLQAQITESEKLASIGQLVGGAAHELNNPIAAMLGYSDLLMNTTLSAEQQNLATRIGQHVRRTRSLVASLISFAKQTPTNLAPVDMKTILRTAVKLSEPVSQALKIEVHVDLQEDIPPVMGDSNQLLQVCVQILHNALNAAHQYGSLTLTLAAQHIANVTSIRVFDIRPLSTLPSNLEQPSETSADATAESISGVGLRACQGILQQHHGRVSWQQSKDTGITICIELPLNPPALEKPSAAGVRARWLTQPSA